MAANSSHVDYKDTTWTNEALAPYRRFRKLVGERKFMKDYPQQTLAFLDLPAEIRNQIYGHYLILDPAIELAPKSTGKKGNGIAWAEHIKCYRRDISPRLRMLRVNKQIYQEASGIFYGENEFRFTNCKGWYVLDAFLRTVGPENSSKLRKLVVHVPWYGTVHDNLHDNLGESHGTMIWMMEQLSRMGLRYLKWWSYFAMFKAYGRCQKKLEAAGSLKELKLILPESFELELGKFHTRVGCVPVGPVLDGGKFSSLKIGLVRLHGGFESLDANSTADAHRAEMLGTHRTAEQLAIEKGWELQSVIYDKRGYYPVKPVPLTADNQVVEGTVPDDIY